MLHSVRQTALHAQTKHHGLVLRVVNIDDSHLKLPRHDEALRRDGCGFYAGHGRTLPSMSPAQVDEAGGDIEALVQHLRDRSRAWQIISELAAPLR